MKKLIYLAMIGFIVTGANVAQAASMIVASDTFTNSTIRTSGTQLNGLQIEFGGQNWFAAYAYQFTATGTLLRWSTSGNGRFCSIPVVVRGDDIISVSVDYKFGNSPDTSFVGVAFTTEGQKTASGFGPVELSFRVYPSFENDPVSDTWQLSTYNYVSDNYTGAVPEGPMRDRGTWHTLKLVYNVQTNKATGYLDGVALITDQTLVRVPTIQRACFKVRKASAAPTTELDNFQVDYSPPPYAYDPLPAVGGDAISSTSLSWTNPLPTYPDDVISCDVYLGTDPNAMTKIVNKQPISSVIPPAPLTRGVTYYWRVDCYDPVHGSEIMTPGKLWSFYVIPNAEPIVNAGPDRTVSLTATVSTEGSATDDGIPGPLSILWTGPEGVIFLADNSLVTPVTFPDHGRYVLRLTANDGEFEIYDEVEYFVPSCQDVIAAGLNQDTDVSGPTNEPDCVVNLYDFAVLAEEWLSCTDPDVSGCTWVF